MVEVCAWVGCGIWIGLLHRNSENAQRELRDSVSKSLYADDAEEMFEPPKKLRSGSNLEPSALL